MRGVVLMLLLACGPVFGHTLSIARLDIAQQDGTSEAWVELDLPLRDLALTLALDANRDEQVTWGELDAIRAPLQQWVGSGLALSSDAGACVLQPRGLATRRYDEGVFATVQLAARCPSATGWRVRYGLLFDLDPQHRALVTLRKGTEVDTATIRPDAREVGLSAARERTFRDFLREGVHHILVGYDHLAFLLSLLLPAALVRQQGIWRPVENRGHALCQALGIVTAFTLAHSVTLSLAALTWIRPASHWIEPAIAASVLLVALNNIRPLVTRKLWALGFGFGLLHGFGFAGALTELGLPDSMRLLALLGFNLGVELGQIVVVCAALPLLFALRRRRWYADVAMPLLSLAVAAVSAAWIWQRVSA